MTRSHSRLASALMATAAGLLLAWQGASPVQAQEKPADKPAEKPADKPKEAPKDEDLERLLDKIDESKSADKSKDKDKNKADKPKAPGEVAPGDKDLDKLLEGLGQSADKPAPDDKKQGGAGGTPPPDEPKDDKSPKPDQLKPENKDLDERLEELTGRKPKKKPGDQKQQGQGQGEEGGPMGQIVKEMREVEQRLGKTDTGEETRKKQTEIVKNLDQLIEQMKNSPGGSQGLKMLREGKKPGQPQPGQPGNQQGAMANGANKMTPEKPRPKAPMPEMAKAIWGQLPAQYRDDISNVMNEHPLPSKIDLIRLYYLSLGKKTSNQEN